MMESRLLRSRLQSLSAVITAVAAKRSEVGGAASSAGGLMLLPYLLGAYRGGFLTNSVAMPIAIYFTLLAVVKIFFKKWYYSSGYYELESYREVVVILFSVLGRIWAYTHGTIGVSKRLLKGYGSITEKEARKYQIVRCIKAVLSTATTVAIAAAIGEVTSVFGMLSALAMMLISDILFYRMFAPYKGISGGDLAPAAPPEDWHIWMYDRCFSVNAESPTDNLTRQTAVYFFVFDVVSTVSFWMAQNASAVGQIVICIFIFVVFATFVFLISVALCSPHIKKSLEGHYK